MEKIRVTDEWLYRYMPIVDEAMIRELEDHTDYEYPFTHRFEHRMKKLMRREAHPWMNAWYGLSKMVAILFVCAFSSLFVLTMSVQAYRIRFFETVQSILEDSMIYSYSADQNRGIISRKEPGYLPQGYQERDRIVLEQLFSVIYTNGKGEMITWDQMLVQDGGALAADSEYDEWIEKEINGKKVSICLYDNGFVMAYCEYGECVYVLTADSLGLDEVCAIYESIAMQ